MENAENYPRHRYPIEIVSHAIWLYSCFALSLRDVKEILLSRGVEASHETVRNWLDKFGLDYANKVKRRQPQQGTTWHMDEMRIKINGKRYWLWRAVDEAGYELDILIHPRRNKQAAKRFFKKLLKGLQYVPARIVTDKLRSYKAAKDEILPGVFHIQEKGANMRAELSHQATRQQERCMRNFKSTKHVQRFLTIHGRLKNLFYCGRYKYSAQTQRDIFNRAMAQYYDIAQQAKCA